VNALSNIREVFMIISNDSQLSAAFNLGMASGIVIFTAILWLVIAPAIALFEWMFAKFTGMRFVVVKRDV